MPSGMFQSLLPGIDPAATNYLPRGFEYLLLPFQFVSLVVDAPRCPTSRAMAHSSVVIRLYFAPRLAKNLWYFSLSIFLTYHGRSNAVVRKRTNGAAASHTVWKRSIKSGEHASSSLKVVTARKSFSFKSSICGCFGS